MTAIQSVDALLETFSDSKADDIKESVDTECGDIETNIYYSNNRGERYVIETPTTSKPAGSYKVSMKLIKHKIINGRDIGCMFGSHGFQLLNQKTKLSTKDFYTNPDGIIEKIYYQEIESTIRALTGAPYIVTIHHQVRNAGDKPKDATVNIGPAAHAAHCDYSEWSAINMFKAGLLKISKDLKEKIDFTKGRFAVINCWRNISDINTIQNDHLALCDPRSVIAPDDYLKYDYVTSAYRTEAYYLNASHADLHQWYYFPGMAKNELLVFMQYDSDYKSNVRFGFHTAIKDPTVNPTTCPKRESIEARLVAFFPKYRPNTIPKQVEETKEYKLETAVNGITGAIKVPEYWPDEAKKEMTKKLKDCDNIRTVIEWLVEGSKKGGFHGLGEASDEECKNVVDEIMKNADQFKQTALKNFPFNT